MNLRWGKPGCGLKLPAGPPLDLIVACGGGNTDGFDLIQAHKALDAASRFLRDGGEILYFAALDGGAGSPEMEAFIGRPTAGVDHGSLSETMGAVWTHDPTAGGKDREIPCSPVLGRNVRSHQPVGFEAVDEPETVLDRWRAEKPGATVGVMAASAVLPLCRVDPDQGHNVKTHDHRRRRGTARVRPHGGI